MVLKMKSNFLVTMLLTAAILSFPACQEENPNLPSNNVNEVKAGDNFQSSINFENYEFTTNSEDSEFLNDFAGGVITKIEYTTDWRTRTRTYELNEKLTTDEEVWFDVTELRADGKVLPSFYYKAMAKKNKETNGVLLIYYVVVDHSVPTEKKDLNESNRYYLTQKDGDIFKDEFFQISENSKWVLSSIYSPHRYMPRNESQVYRDGYYIEFEITRK